jgi:predicted DNA-binding transcriptional regulator YafY
MSAHGAAHRSTSSTARPLVFRYRLARALARGAISRRFESQQVVERLPGGDVVIEAEGRSAFVIVRTLLRYAESAELLWPPELRTEIVATLARTARMYRASGDNTE